MINDIELILDLIKVGGITPTLLGAIANAHPDELRFLQRKLRDLDDAIADQLGDSDYMHLVGGGGSL